MVLGKFAELSIPTQDLDASIAYWELLGFAVSEKHEEVEPWDWAAMYDGQLVVVLHRTDEWSTPAITYFAPDVQRVFDELDDQDIEILHTRTDEDGLVTGITMRSPEGQLIFILLAPDS